MRLIGTAGHFIYKFSKRVRLAKEALELVAVGELSKKECDEPGLMPGIQWQHLIDVFCVVGLLASSSLNGDRKTSAVLGCYVICDQLAESDVRTGDLAGGTYVQEAPPSHFITSV